MSFDGYIQHDRHGGVEDDPGECFPAAWLCFCGDPYGKHAEGVACTGCKCKSFEPSPFSCPVCGWPAVSADDAMHCCICPCTHGRKRHQTKSAASIARVHTRCQAPYCPCPGFGGVAAVLQEASDVVNKMAEVGR